MATISYKQHCFKLKRILSSSIISHISCFKCFLNVQFENDLSRDTCFDILVRAGANESQKTRNKKQNGLAHLRFLVCVTPKQKKNIA